MNFNSRDIEAVAKGRVNDRESKTSNTWNIGAMIGLIVGWVLRMLGYPNSNMWGWGIMTLAILAFAYYWFYLLPKKQKVYANQLWVEYKKEQDNTEVKQ